MSTPLTPEQETIAMRLHCWDLDSKATLPGLAEIIALATIHNTLDTLCFTTPNRGWWQKASFNRDDYDWTKTNNFTTLCLSKARHKALKLLIESGIKPTALLREKPEDVISLSESCAKVIEMYQKKGYKPAALSAESLAIFLNALHHDHPNDFCLTMSKACQSFSEGRIWITREGCTGFAEAEAVRKLWPILEYLRKKKGLGDATALYEGCKKKIEQARTQTFDQPLSTHSKSDLYRSKLLYGAIRSDDAQAFKALDALCGAADADKLTVKIAIEYDSDPLTWLAHALKMNSGNCARCLLDNGANPWTASAEFKTKSTPGHLSGLTPNPIAVGCSITQNLIGKATKSVALDAGICGPDDAAQFAGALFEACKRDADLMDPGSGTKALATAVDQARNSAAWTQYPASAAIFDTLAEHWHLSQFLEGCAVPVHMDSPPRKSAL